MWPRGRDATVGDSAFTLDREDVLAHLLYLREAFSGAENCSFRGEVRKYLLEVAEAGNYAVTIDAAFDGFGCSVAPLEEGDVAEVDDDGRPTFCCAERLVPEKSIVNWSESVKASLIASPKEAGLRLTMWPMSPVLSASLLPTCSWLMAEMVKLESKHSSEQPPKKVGPSTRATGRYCVSRTPQTNRTHRA